uniref:RxLR effector protein n=1 Tax=Phytophthora ramorum TaxID=164328 RepID=H3H495_PHYRM
MRLQYIVLLATAAFVATGVTASHEVADSKLVTSRINAAQNTLTSKRFLRADSVTGEDDEERAISFKSIPGIEAIKNVFSKKVTLKDLLKYADRKKSSEYMFSKLKLDKAVAYVRLINPRHPEAAMVTSLTSRYGDDVLSKMLEAGLKMPKTKEAATALQTKQLEGWKNMGLSADDAFKTLNLNVGAEKVFKNPNLNAWVKYMDDLNSGLPRKNQVSMIDTFRRNFGDDALSKMLVAAKKDPVTEKIATDMQASLLSKWVLARKDPEAVSEIAGSSLAGKMLHRTYLEKFNLRWPDRL